MGLPRLRQKRQCLKPLRHVAVVHDTMEGTAHCVECGGNCTLTGADAAYTALVRAAFEAEAIYPNTAKVPYAIIRQFEENGVRIAQFRERAVSVTL